MDSYSRLADCYDIFMDETPYQKWLEYVLDVFVRYDVPKELVLDLGCGTGTFTRMLADSGYDMIGVDSSCEMLQKAMNKDSVRGRDILYLEQDMREFELYGTVRAVVSVCDSLNYLLTDEDMIQTFSLVENYLDQNGVFVFDFNSVYKYEQIGEATIAENRDDYSFIWENYYSHEDHLNEYDLTIFSKEGELFRRSMETHVQRGYTLDEMKAFLAKAHLEFLEANDADTGAGVSDESERIHVVARCVRPKRTS